MADNAAQPTIAMGSVALVLTATAGFLGVAAWWVVPFVYDPSVGAERAVVWAGLVAWGSLLLGLAPVAIGGRCGMIAMVSGWHIAAGTRVLVCILATAVAIRFGGLPAGPWVVTLMGMYLPLLFCEIALVGRQLWVRAPVRPCVGQRA